MGAVLRNVHRMRKTKILKDCEKVATKGYKK